MPEKTRVLAVDDMPINLMILKRCLDERHFEVDSCQSAADFLDKFKKQSYDVLLLDIIMPGIDGFELRSLVRRTDREIPVIFLTTMMEDCNMTLLKQITGDTHSYYVNKNQIRELLESKINEAVSQCRERRSERVYRENMESELEVAGQLQKYLLPDWCQQDGKVTLSCCYSPLMHVSGDIFELFPLPESRYLLFAGDIAGHGVSAALYVAAVQTILRMKVRERESDFSLNALLADLNSFFCRELGSQIYMTAMAAVFDFENNHLSMHSAGHLPLQICPADGKVFSADDSKCGVPLGMFAESEYPAEDNYEYDFADDTLFFSFTDGICDMVNGDDMQVSIEDLQDVLVSLVPDTDTVSLPFRVKSALMQMGYDKVCDDITLIALRKRASGEKRTFLLSREQDLSLAAEQCTGAVRQCVQEGVTQAFSSNPESGLVYLAVENSTVRILKKGGEISDISVIESVQRTSAVYGDLQEMCYFLKGGGE